MKKLLLTVSLILAPLSSFAGKKVNCDGSSSNDSLLLFINNSKIVQVRILAEDTFPKTFRAQLVSEQSNTALYRLSGFPGLMDVQNEVINGQGGWLRLQGYRYFCDAN